MPNFVHTDKGKSFLSKELKDFLLERGIASSRLSPYYPTGNSQVERYNGIIWKSIRLALITHNLPVSSWEAVLPDALQSVRSLLNTTTNCTLHELFCNFNRRSPSGKFSPAWLSTPGAVLLLKFVKAHKNDDLTEEVQLIEANPIYASIRYVNGRESTVSIYDLAPCPRTVETQQNKTPLLDPTNTQSDETQSDVDVKEPENTAHPVQIPEEVATEVRETPGSSTADVNAHKIVSLLPPCEGLFVKNRGLPPSRYGTVFSH